MPARSPASAWRMVSSSRCVTLLMADTTMATGCFFWCSAALAAEHQKKQPVAIVVSAMSKVTHLLLDTMRHAEAGDRAGMDADLALLRTRHEEACRELLPASDQGAVLAKLHDVIDEFERIAGGMAMLGERPPRSVDEAVAIGERLDRKSTRLDSSHVSESLMPY